tara:strand:+ start:9282 stop:9815 length:534 start_codon:yes stop_codon:yes gene_type:complete
MAILTGIAAAVGGLSAASAIAAVGVGVSAIGAAGASNARKSSAAYNRDVALTNEQIAKDNARDVVLRGREEVYTQRRAVARELSTTRVQAAGQGMTVDEAGTTPQHLVADMAEAGELDVMRLRNNIQREERRALVQGTSFAAQAGQFDLQRSSESPFRSALVAGVGAAVQSSDILFS